MSLTAILFDLHGTLVYSEHALTAEEASDFLQGLGYAVYPQSWDAASRFVGMIDYPKHGYSDRHAFLRQVLKRLDVDMADDDLDQLIHLYERRNRYCLFADAAPAVQKARQLGLRTAIVTTIPEFVFDAAIASLRPYVDIVMTGQRASCEKSNPAMYRQTLDELSVAPKQAVMIGDELLVDIRIPKSLGMHPILLDRLNKWQKTPREAEGKVGTLTEAMAVVEKWCRQAARKKQRAHHSCECARL